MNYDIDGDKDLSWQTKIKLEYCHGGERKTTIQEMQSDFSQDSTLEVALDVRKRSETPDVSLDVRNFGGVSLDVGWII